MAEVMDLDLSLEELAKKNSSKNGGKRGRGQARGGRPAPTSDGGGRAASSLKRTSPRASPYSRDGGGAPEGKWGHSGFIEQNNIKGGNLAARMAANRPPGGIDDPKDREPAPRRQRKPIAQTALMSRAMADVTGGAVPTKGRGAISVKGASGATVEVRNLVQGTTAEDVQAIFSDSGPISSASEVPSRIKGAVTVHLKFSNAADAEKARKTFDGQVADGRKLEVVVLTGGLLANVLASGVAPNDKSFDLLPDTPATSGGMRSDALLTDTRAQILTAPKIVGAANQRGR